MIKKCISLLLALALLVPGFAAAEAAAPAYEPNSVIAGLFGEAFENGSIVCADLDLDLALNYEKLGITGEDAATYGAVIEMINTAILSGGVAKTDEGILLVLSGDYTKEGAETGASAGMRICVNKDGFYIETSLLPGERLTANWETAMKMLGMDEATIAQVLALRDVDPQMLISQIEQTVQQALPMIAQVGTPYLNTIVSFLQGLPVSVAEDVAADGYFPAAKQEVTFTLTQKAAGELIAALADQVDADPVLSQVLNMLLTNQDIMGDNAMTVSALCQNLRALAAQMTDESSPIYGIMGYDEAGMPLYASLMNTDASGRTAALNVVNTTEPDSPASYMVELFTVDAQENYSGAYASWMYQGENKNIFDFAAAFEFTLENQTLMSMEYGVGSAAMTTEENMPGYSGYQQMTMSINTGEADSTINVVSSAEMQQCLTADGGEIQMAYGVTDTYVGEITAQSSTESYFGAIPSDEGPLGLYASTIVQPETGVDSATIAVNLYAIPLNVPERTSVLALETATQQDLDGYVTRLMTAAQSVMEALYAQLPAPLLDAMSGEAAAETAPAAAM